MSEQNPDSNPKNLNYIEWAKRRFGEAPEVDLDTQEYKKGDIGQSIEDLELELFCLEQDRMFLQHDQEYEAEMESRSARRKAYARMIAEVDATEMEPEKKAGAYEQIQGMIDKEAAEGPPDGLTERVNLNLNIGALQQKLTALRNPKLSRGEAAGAQELPKRPAKPLLQRLRSVVKRAILLELFQHPNASNLEICHFLDEDGVEVPAWLKIRGKDESYEGAYKDSDRKPKIEKEIARVRAVMRALNLLGAR